MAWDGPKWGREDFFPANPGLANILGRTDLDFDMFYILLFRFEISESNVLDLQTESGFAKGNAFSSSE